MKVAAWADFGWQVDYVSVSVYRSFGMTSLSGMANLFIPILDRDPWRTVDAEAKESYHMQGEETRSGVRTEVTA